MGRSNSVFNESKEWSSPEENMTESVDTCCLPNQRVGNARKIRVIGIIPKEGTRRPEYRSERPLKNSCPGPKIHPHGIKENWDPLCTKD